MSFCRPHTQSSTGLSEIPISSLSYIPPQSRGLRCLTQPPGWSPGTHLSHSQGLQVSGETTCRALTVSFRAATLSPQHSTCAHVCVRTHWDTYTQAQAHIHTGTHTHRHRHRHTYTQAQAHTGTGTHTHRHRHTHACAHVDVLRLCCRRLHLYTLEIIFLVGILPPVRICSHQEVAKSWLQTCSSQESF